MKKIFNLMVLLFCAISLLEAQMPFQVQLVVNNQANTLSVNLRNVDSAKPTMGQSISSINMKLLGQVSNIISIASTNYTMQMPSTSGSNMQVITMLSSGYSSPENWVQNQWVTVVVYNLSPGTYSDASFSVQPDLDMDNSDVDDPIMSVVESGLLNRSLVIVSTILPIELASFSVQKVSEEEALLKWQSEMEVNFQGFEIERSTEEDKDGFKTIGAVAGKGAGNYTFNDKDPSPGNNYYRLKMIDLDGTYEYSPIRTVKFESQTRLILYSNPSSNGEISFALKGMENSNDLSLSVMNSAGELVKSLYLNNVENNTGYITKITDTAGVYFLRVSLSNGQTFVEKLVISK
jgi:hypothetical protein